MSRPHDVSVWFAPLDGDAGDFSLLSPDERDRANRFAILLVRSRFISARAFLRTTLAQQAGCEPHELRFGYGPYGKPFLIDSELRFNLSHSAGWAALAISQREVGIDIEEVRPDRSIEDLAERFFSRRESETLRALPEGERCAAFFRCWTRKEAFIKLIGEGLSFPLDEFDVTLRPDEPAALLSVRGAPAHQWSMREIAAPAGFAAALAVEGTNEIVLIRR